MDDGNSIERDHDEFISDVFYNDPTSQDLFKEAYQLTNQDLLIYLKSKG